MIDHTTARSPAATATPRRAPSRRAFALRIDATVLSAVERLASHELRSANAQIEYLLREALQRRGALPPAPAGPLLASEGPR